ncbi:hypothetical protein [Photorhabdus laumondii]|uniref:hypothetical protein n=1 Tax=Photorhabdus laumondii TaxID=2218628 RepID=UPI003D9CB5F0
MLANVLPNLASFLKYEKETPLFFIEDGFNFQNLNPGRVPLIKTPEQRKAGDTQSPAFLCSGVILRGTIHSNDYKFWQPSPSSIKSGGVSFSYLRKDAKFKRLAYGYKNGFIIFPEHIAPEDRVDFSVLCAFPIDGYTRNH